jgi:hypothetical protein
MPQNRTKILTPDSHRVNSCGAENRSFSHEKQQAISLKKLA